MSLFTFIVCIVGAFLAGSHHGPFVANKALSLIGKVDIPKLDYFESSPPVGNNDCELLYENIVQACEDMTIIGNDVFMACGKTDERVKYFPPLGLYNETGVKMQGPFYKMNLKTMKLTLLKRIGGPDRHCLHGMGEWVHKDDPTKVNFFFVNHLPEGSIVDIYEHKLGTDKMKHLKTVNHAAMYTQNDIAPTGPMTFYATNDHKFRTGYLRHIEDSMGPFTFHNIVYCDAEKGPNGTCREVLYGEHQYPNGIMAIDDGKQVLVADTSGAYVFRYSVDPKTKRLQQIEKIVSV